MHVSSTTIAAMQQAERELLTGTLLLHIHMDQQERQRATLVSRHAHLSPAPSSVAHGHAGGTRAFAAASALLGTYISVL
jgi:hypothetical protein